MLVYKEQNYNVTLWYVGVTHMIAKAIIMTLKGLLVAALMLVIIASVLTGVAKFSHMRRVIRKRKLKRNR